MSRAARLRTVRIYFRDVLDRGRAELIERIFDRRCVMHRPGGDVFGWDGVRGVVARGKESFARFSTEIEELFECGRKVVARLEHRGSGAGIWRSRLGVHSLRGKTVVWKSIAIFRFSRGKIAEEWVSRDDLGILLQIGAVGSKRRRKLSGGSRAGRG
jgi:predicted ester cyclase